MKHIGMFLEALEAYNVDIGVAFPKANPRSVLLVFRECNKSEPTSQKQIENACGISQPNATKLLARMIQRGWLDPPNRDHKTGVKTFKISFDGYGMLDSFDRACQRAAKNASKTKATIT